MSQPNDSKFVERDEQGDIIAVYACPQLKKGGGGFRTDPEPITDERRPDFIKFRERSDMRPLRPVAPPLEGPK